MRKLAGKRILITGAAGGIGTALAVACAKERGNVVLADIDPDGLARTAEAVQAAGGSAETHQVDLTDRAAITQLVENVLAGGPVDILINNAGVGFYGPTESMTEQQWDWLLDINLHAAIHVTRQLLPTLVSRPEPHIVNMCSIAGLVAAGRFAAYHVSKFALVGFTEALRAEYGRRGVGVSAICPGAVRTGFYKAAVSGRKASDVPEPPALITATPETVAAKTIRAIRRNKRITIVTPMAHALYHMKRLTPGLIDFANQFSRRKFRRKKPKKPAPVPAGTKSESAAEHKRAA